MKIIEEVVGIYDIHKFVLILFSDKPMNEFEFFKRIPAGCA